MLSIGGQGNSDTGKFMLQSIAKLYGYKLGASDGELGRVKDFYFDDQTWTIRYVVADTGSWLPGRQVLIPPHVCGKLDLEGKILRVNLTRKQIEKSPSIETHKPVSRQFEEEYHRHFGWPYYWQGDAMLGLSGVPIVEAPPMPGRDVPVASGGTPPKAGDAHLRSAQGVNGYQLRAGDEAIGHVCDFMINDQLWKIRQLVIKTGHRLSGREVQMATSAIDRISYEESTVYVNLTKEAIEQTPAQVLVPAGAVI